MSRQVVTKTLSLHHTSTEKTKTKTKYCWAQKRTPTGFWDVSDRCTSTQQWRWGLHFHSWAPNCPALPVPTYSISALTVYDTQLRLIGVSLCSHTSRQVDSHPPYFLMCLSRSDKESWHVHSRTQSGYCLHSFIHILYAHMAAHRHFPPPFCAYNRADSAWMAKPRRCPAEWEWKGILQAKEEEEQ